MDISDTFKLTVLLHLLAETLSQYPTSGMQFPGNPLGGPMGPQMQMQMPHQSMGQPISIYPQTNGLPPFPIQMPMGLAQPKLPLVVMPYNKQSKKDRKNRKSKKDRRIKKKKSSKRHIIDSGSSDTSSSSHETRRSYKPNRNYQSQVLTPVISYVTKDGYVVYQKKIMKKTARDWLEFGKNDLDLHKVSEENSRSASDSLEFGSQFKDNRKVLTSNNKRNKRSKKDYNYKRNVFLS